MTITCWTSWFFSFQCNFYFKLELLLIEQNALLEFSSVVSAKEQIVAGTMYYLTIEVIQDGEKKLYQAKVLDKPWMNFKELEDFKPLLDSEPADTSTATA